MCTCPRTRKNKARVHGCFESFPYALRQAVHQLAFLSAHFQLFTQDVGLQQWRNGYNTQHSHTLYLSYAHPELLAVSFELRDSERVQ